MSISNRFKMSQDRLDALKAELLYLETEKEKEVAELIKEARSFGDLSENSEYDEAKNEQAAIEQRIADIEAMLANVRVINEHELSNDLVSVGSRVRVYDEDFAEEVEYTVVGASESNPLENRISEESPIGRALIGASVGETVKAETPGGEVVLKVLAISK